MVLQSATLAEKSSNGHSATPATWLVILSGGVIRLNISSSCDASKSEYEAARESQSLKHKQPTLLSMAQCTATYYKSNPKVHRLDALVVCLLCIEGLPFCLLESSAFIAFVAELNPRYKLPTHQALSALLIIAKYNEVKAEIAQHLATAGAHAAFTTNGWTSSNNVAFTGVMLHYVDNNFNAIKVFDCPPYTGSHTSKVLAEHATAILAEYGINLDVPVHIVTDNASNVKVAMMKLMRNVQWRPFFAHTLQLVIVTALESKGVCPGQCAFQG